ncbi:MAG TPA: glycosyltransferase, partial [Bryobacteraceae bacterium]|nr:glycosyltransferase [Bryobacteraceae bacterium]
MPLRILHVFDRYLSGGFERHFDLVVQKLHAAGAGQFCYGGEGTQRLSGRPEFGEVVCGNLAALGPADVVAEVRGMERLIRQRGVTVVHIHPFMGLMPGALAAALAGVPHVITMHAPPRPGDMATEFGALHFETVSQLAIPYATAITAVSEEALEGTRAAFGITNGAERLTIVRNPVMVPGPETPADTALRDGLQKGVFISRLDADKEASARAALDLFADIQRRFAQWHFAMCGDGNRRCALQRYAEDTGLRGAIWHGWHDDIGTIIRDSALVVGMDRVVIEAMAQARAVVVAGHSGLADFVTPANVREFQAGNYGGRGSARSSPAALAERLPAVLADADARRQLQEIARADHGADVVAEQYRRVYERARGSAPEASALEVMRVLEASRADTIRECWWLEELGPAGFSFWPLARRALFFEIGRQYGQGLRQAEHARRLQGLTIDKLAGQIAAFQTERRAELEASAEEHVRAAEERIATLEWALGDTRRAALARDAALEKTTAELMAATAQVRELEMRLERVIEERRRVRQQLRDAANAPTPPLFQRIRGRRNGSIIEADEPDDAVTPPRAETTLDSLAIEVPPIREPRPEEARARCAVIVLPIFDYEFRYQRPQQIAAHLAKAGHRVYWVSPTRMFAAGAKPFSIAPLLPNLYEVSVQGESLDLYRGELTGENLGSLAAALRALYREQLITESAVLVQFPSWRRVALALREEHGARVLYDCMDDWQNWPAEPRISEFALGEERALLTECDVLTVSSHEFVNRHARNVPSPVLIRNAADYAFFRRTGAVAGKATLRPPVIGYYGVIAEWFDVELVLAAAKSRPQYSFVLIGAVHDVELAALAELPHVTVLGE